MLVLLLASVAHAATTVELVTVADPAVSSYVGDGYSADPQITADGRYILFVSTASNLVPDDTGFIQNLFRHDTQAGTTERINPTAVWYHNWVSAPRVTADGHFVYYWSSSEIVRRDLTTPGAAEELVSALPDGTPSRCSVNGTSLTISRDGRYVVFYADHPDMALGGDTAPALLLRDMTTTGLQRVNGGIPLQDPWTQKRFAISDDGLYLAFAAQSQPQYGLLPRVVRRNLTTGELLDLGQDLSQGEISPTTGIWSVATSADGRYVSWQISSYQLFRSDCVAGSTELVNVNAAGVRMTWIGFGHALAPDGMSLWFAGLDSTLPGTAQSGLWKRTFGPGATTSAVGTGQTSLYTFSFGAMSASTDGTLAFDHGYGLVPEDTQQRDVYYCRQGDAPRWVSRAADRMTQANGDSFACGISGDGGTMLIGSFADNMAPGDTNRCVDLFIRRTASPSLTKLVLRSDGAACTRDVCAASLSRDGRYVAYLTTEALVPEDLDSDWDVYRTAVAGGTVMVGSGVGSGLGYVDPYTDVAPAISCDGRFIAWLQSAPAVSGAYRIMRKDLVTGSVVQCDLDAAGTPLPTVTQRVRPTLSDDGRYVSFVASTTASGGSGPLGAGCYRKDLLTGMVLRLDTTQDGLPPDEIAGLDAVGLSADGRYAVFSSWAGNLVNDDTNGSSDIFRRDTQTGAIIRVSLGDDGRQLGGNRYPAVSGDGRRVAFYCEDLNVGIGSELWGSHHLLMRDCQSNRTQVMTETALPPYGVHVPGGMYLSSNGGVALFDSRVRLLAEDRNLQINDVYRVTMAVAPSSGDPGAGGGASASDSGAGGGGGGCGAGASGLLIALLGLVGLRRSGRRPGPRDGRG